MRERATLAGGCFWCLEAIFQELRGVEEVIPGYSGGDVKDPSYHQVTTGTTGHAEAVQLTFDTGEISYRDILEVFFTIHDPTMLNHQGADVGTQYRSAVFYHNNEQKESAERVISEIEKSGTWGRPIVTELAPFQEFYPAEDYHHDYYKRHGEEPYCRLVIEPKVAKLRKHFTDKLKR